MRTNQDNMKLQNKIMKLRITKRKKTDNQPNETKEGEVTEQDNDSDNKRTEEKHEPMGDEEMEIIQDTDSKLHVQKEVKEEAAEKDESKDNEEEKTDTGNEEKQDESKGNEKEQSDNEEDTEKIRISKRSITITAKPPMLRGETRAQCMCQLARQLKQRNKSQPTKDEWEDCSS